MKKIFWKLVNLGINDKTNVSAQKNIRIINAFSYVAIISHLSAIPLIIYYWEIAFPALFICLLMLALMTITLYLNIHGDLAAASVIGGLAAINNIFWFTIFLGTETRVHFLMPAVMIGAFYYFPYRIRRLMFLIIALSLSAFIFLEIWFQSHNPFLLFPENVMPIAIMYIDFTFIGIVFGFMYNGYLIFHDSEFNLKHEREKSEALLLNILPPVIAQRLKNKERSIADKYKSATVLFADIVNFTELSKKIKADELVSILDSIFTEFDKLVFLAGAEKIKTIGDAYMIATGLPIVTHDHTEVMVLLAQKMLQEIENNPVAQKANLSIRIGIHTGPVVAGIIGQKKFSYDMWGDTVNTASRMEMHGEPGRIHVSEAVYKRVKNRFRFIPRGKINVKGKGLMETWYIQRPEAVFVTEL